MPVNTTARLVGLYKEVYADGIEKLLPDVAKIYRSVKFGDGERIGNAFHLPVQVGQEQGVSYAGPGAGAFALAPSIAMSMQDAQVQGNQITIRTQIAMDTVARSLANKAAFAKATVPIFEANLDSHVKRLELSFLYGRAPTGIGTATTAAAVDATNTTITFSPASWAVGVWSGMERARLVFYRTDTNAIAGLGGGGTGVFQVASVNPDTRQIVVTGVAADSAQLIVDVTAVNCFAVLYGVTGLLVADGGTGVVTPWAAAACLDCAGIDTILQNAGVLFNINATTWSLWRGNNFAVGGAPLTMARVQAGVNRAVGKGGLQEKGTLYVSTDTWPNLHADLAALRAYDQSYSTSKATAGSESITYHGASGEIDVVAHSCVKGGEAWFLPLKRCSRVGACDVTFDVPGREEEMFTLMPNNNGYEVRSYSDQAFFIKTPAKCVRFTGIVNT